MGADLPVPLHNVLPDRYPLTGISIDEILPLSDELRWGRLIDYGIILPRMQALYEVFAASDLDNPGSARPGSRNGFPVYAWPYEDRHAWTTTRARSVRSVLSWLTSA